MGTRPAEEILKGLKPSRPTTDRWARSEWHWLPQLPPAAKGSIGVSIVRDWCTAAGYTCAASPSSDADLVVDGVRVEVKLSCEWANGTFRFQQLRDQEWDVLVAVGVQPDQVKLWVLDKATALELATGQHTGSGAAETSWLCWPAAAAPAETGSVTGDQKVAAKRFAQLRRRVRPRRVELRSCPG